MQRMKSGLQPRESAASTRDKQASKSSAMLVAAPARETKKRAAFQEAKRRASQAREAKEEGREARAAEEAFMQSWKGGRQANDASARSAIGRALQPYGCVEALVGRSEQ